MLKEYKSDWLLFLLPYLTGMVCGFFGGFNGGLMVQERLDREKAVESQKAKSDPDYEAYIRFKANHQGLEDSK